MKRGAGMFVCSMKMSRIKVFAVFALVLAAVLVGVGFLASSHADTDAAAKAQTPKLLAQTNEQRIDFLKQFGWEVSAEPVEVVEVVVPTEFDQTYEKYNIIQRKQGFDLADYKGKRVKRWTYEIKNYPEGKTGVRANLLVLDGKLIGGDVSSVELNGFMHGFKLEG